MNQIFRIVSIAFNMGNSRETIVGAAVKKRNRMVSGYCFLNDMTPNKARATNYQDFKFFLFQGLFLLPLDSYYHNQVRR